jgi:methyl-accepting chemotaxis protein
MFKKMKIGARLLTAFAVTLALLLVISVIGIVSIQMISNDSNTMYQKNLNGIFALGKYQYSFMTLRLSSYKTTYGGTVPVEKQADELQKINDTYFAEMAQYLLDFKSSISSKDDQAAYEDLNTLTAKYKSANQDALAAQKETTRDMDKVNALVKINAGVATDVNTKLNDVIAKNKAQAEASAATNSRTAAISLILTILLSIVSLVISIILALTITKTITSPINKLLTNAKKLAEGDMNIELDMNSNDEIGVLAQSFHTVIIAIDVLISDVKFLVVAAKEGRLEARADASKHNGEYRTIVEGFNDTLEAIIEPVNEATSVLKNVSVNDYTIKVEGQYQGDLKVMTDSINNTLIRLLSVQRVFENLAVGDLSLLEGFRKIGKRSENDKLMPAGIKMMENLQDMSDDAEMLSLEAAKGNLDIRGDVSKYEGTYKQLINGINSIIDAMASPISEAVGVLEMMAQNDMTHSMNGQYQGAFDALAQSINTMTENLSETLGEINTSAEQVASGTQQVSAGSQALSQGATEQASSIEELTASLSEIAGQTRQNAINAGQANDLALAARDSAADGKVQMSELQQAMTAINESSANISKVIKVIDDIAFQTNLLALNAAVEAARAGQYGKGFAVVAEEVRNLAQRSANAAKETTEMIEGSIKKVSAGTQIANDTASALVKIVGSVEKATELVGGIAKASNDQAMAVAQVNTGIEQVSQVTQTNSATAEESAAASEELSSQATLLKEMVGRFSLKGQAHIGGQKASFQPQAPARALGASKPSSGKPKIALNDREFGKY